MNLSASVRTFFFTILVSIVFLNQIHSQNKISGIILDKSTEKPIVGVKIKEKGSNKQTISNEEGEFELLYENQLNTLIFSHIAYEDAICSDTNCLRKIYLDPLTKTWPSELQFKSANEIFKHFDSKNKKDTSDNYFFKAYFKQFSNISGEISLQESQFVLKWNKTWGPYDWQPENIRHANIHKEGGMLPIGFIHNLTLYLNPLDVLSFPTRKNNLKNLYTLSLSHFINHGKNNEMAVYSCIANRGSQLKSWMSFDGEFYIDTKTLEVKRIVGLFSSRKTKNKSLAYIDSFFDNNEKGINVFSHQYINNEFYYKKKIVKSKGFLFFTEEVNDNNLIEKMEPLGYNCISKPPKKPYDQIFWNNFSPIKRTELEKQFIKILEFNNSFISRGGNK